ncbi:MAG: pilus assembly protein PilP [Betaproteobacteria bacterium]|nr:pilus assembly protein PilP [Betaproteobacteria bacterium]
MKRIAPLLAVLAALVLSACDGEDHQSIRQWMKETTQGMKGRVPPLPEIKPFPIVAYDAGDLKDPFNPAKIETERKSRTSGGGIKPDFDRFKEPLEAYPLDALKMVGLIQKGKMLNAVIQADKSVFLVKIGSYMGQNFGMVVNITESELQLKELVQDPVGDWEERTSTLQLQEQEAKK